LDKKISWKIKIKMDEKEKRDEHGAPD